MSDFPGEPAHGRNEGARSARQRLVSWQDPQGLAAAAIIIAVLLILAGAVLVGITENGPVDGWKFRVKTIGLGTGTIGPRGFSTGSAPFVGLAIVVALSLVSGSANVRRSSLAPMIGAGAAAAAAWLLFLTLLGVVVDLTDIGDDFFTLAGILLVDLGSLLIFAAATVWGIRLAGRDREG